MMKPLDKTEGSVDKSDVAGENSKKTKPSGLKNETVNGIAEKTVGKKSKDKRRRQNNKRKQKHNGNINSMETPKTTPSDSGDSKLNGGQLSKQRATSSTCENEENSSSTCELHPEKKLMTCDEMIQSIRSGGTIDDLNFNNPASMLCNSCSGRVALYFDYLQETLKDVMSDLLGLQKRKRCLECVKLQLQKDFVSSPRSQSDDLHDDTVQVDQNQRETSAKPSNADIQTQSKLEVNGSEPKEKISQVNKCPFVRRNSHFKKDDSVYQPRNVVGSATSPAEHNNCDPTKCHIRRWYCPQPEGEKAEQELKEPSAQSRSSVGVQDAKLPPLIDNQSDTVDRSDQVAPSISLPQAEVENVVSHKNEAYVTLATCDLHAIGCLVLGHSMRLTRTTRDLAVIISGSISASVRELLADIFDVIFVVNDHELVLLNDPDIGVSLIKIYAWKLTQYSKCVFLDCDTFMLQNCDELFDRPELSAVPDIGWPDCFNSSVFTYVPSSTTFKQLFNTAQLKGIQDGGEQGLLNAYFNDIWKSNINCRLPFIYNLMANVSYTYAPAFEQFGKNAKIVHFLGTYKPWNIQWSPISGNMSPSALSNIHKSYYSFIHSWLTIFIHYIMPLFSTELQKMLKGFYSITVRDLMNMYEGSTDELPDHIPTNPSMRYRHDENQTIRVQFIDPLDEVASKLNDESSELSLQDNDALPIVVKPSKESDCQIEHGEDHPDENKILDEQNTAETNEEKETTSEPCAIKEEEISNLPDYNRMYLWEKGQMDYTGFDASSNIMKKLDNLILK